MRGVALRRAVPGALLLLILLGTSTVRGQSTDRPPESDSVSVRSGKTPRGALIRSAVVPGWGQVYNGQILKAPIIAGAIGGLAFAVIRLNRDYLLYRHAYQYKAFQELVDRGTLSENPRASFVDEYDQLAANLGPVSSGPLRTRRDGLRRNRDLAILGIGVVWAIAVLDAYVAAHLLDFDIGEDLSLRIRPDTDPGGSPVVAPSLVWHPSR